MLGGPPAVRRLSGSPPPRGGAECCPGPAVAGAPLTLLAGCGWRLPAGARPPQTVDTVPAKAGKPGTLPQGNPTMKPHCDELDVSAAVLTCHLAAACTVPWVAGSLTCSCARAAGRGSGAVACWLSSAVGSGAAGGSGTLTAPRYCAGVPAASLGGEILQSSRQVSNAADQTVATWLCVAVWQSPGSPLGPTCFVNAPNCMLAARLSAMTRLQPQLVHS
jgi:hypothetical protein